MTAADTSYSAVRSMQGFVQTLLQREQQGPANVLIKYLVPPQVQKDFIQVFKEVKDETAKVTLFACRQ